MQEVFGFPNVGFAFSVAALHVAEGTRCKVFKHAGVWYVAI